MFRTTNSLILRSTFWLYTHLLVQCTDTAADRWHGLDGKEFHLNRATGRQQCRCIVPKAVYTVSTFSWGWANLSPETCRVNLKRSIKGICCILLVAYIIHTLNLSSCTRQAEGIGFTVLKREVQETRDLPSYSVRTKLTTSFSLRGKSKKCDMGWPRLQQ
jgi:hypothetical protein